MYVCRCPQWAHGCNKYGAKIMMENGELYNQECIGKVAMTERNVNDPICLS